jgi:hypothetical protein
MVEGYNYHLSIPWHIALAYFRQLKERCQDQCMTLDDKELYRMQGEARAYKKLENLPEHLTIINEEEPEGKEEQT